MLAQESDCHTFYASLEITGTRRLTHWFARTSLALGAEALILRRRRLVGIGTDGVGRIAAGGLAAEHGPGYFTATVEFVGE